MKRILFIGTYTPSNLGAGVGYSNQLLMKLSERCKIDIVYFDYKKEPLYVIPNDNVTVLKRVEINNWYKIKGMLSLPWHFPLFTCRFSWKVCRFLQQQVKKTHYDFVYFDFSQSFAYAPYINHPNKILMAHDVIIQKYSRMKSYLKPWVRFSEPKLLRHGNAIFTFSEKDCKLIKNNYGFDSISTSFFIIPEIRKIYPLKIDNYFVFFGGWSREENYEALEWFLNNVYIHVAGKYHFKIIGGGMPLYLRDRIENLKDIEYLGFIKNPYPIIANSIAEIAPLHKGAGVKVKCIEALACGCPIIGTDVAFEGISSSYSSFMRNATTPSDYVNLINSWRETIDSRRKFKDFFEKDYNQKAILKYILKQ